MRKGRDEKNRGVRVYCIPPAGYLLHATENN